MDHTLIYWDGPGHTFVYLNEVGSVLGTLPRWLQTEVACYNWSICLGLVHQAIPTKARDPFQQIHRKIGLMATLEETKQTTLAIVEVLKKKP